MLTSCGSSKEVATASQKMNPATAYGQETALTSSEEYALLSPGKRASGRGSSWDESTAQQLAEMEARRAFSEGIDAAILSACKRSGIDIQQYSGDNNTGSSVNDGGIKTNTLTKSISQNIVSNTSVVKKNRFYNNNNRIYTIFVCLEYNGEVQQIAKEATKQIMQRVADEDRLKIENELNEFEQEITKELKNKNQQN